MTPISYQMIAANIADATVEGTQVRVSWTCPVTHRALGTSSGTMTADASVTARVGANVQRTVASELIYGAARLVSSLLGGAAGRVVSNAAYTAAADINAKTTSGVDYTESSRRAAIVVAFESVKSSFAWDEARRQFVAR
jgi:hypothetical protein